MSNISLKNTFEKSTQQTDGFIQPAGVLLYDGQHTVVEGNTFEHLQHGVVFNRESFGTQFTAPIIVDNLFSDVMAGVMVPNRTTVSGTGNVTSTLLITCNTFNYNYTQVGRKGYGIRVGFLPQGSSTSLQHSIVIDATNTFGQPAGATMKNDFRVTGSMGVELAVHPVSEFVDVGNHPNNPNALVYKTFRSTPATDNMLGTRADRVTTEFSVSLPIDGDEFSIGNTDCYNTDAGYGHGVNERQSNPNTSGTNNPNEQIKQSSQGKVVRLNNYPNPFSRQTTIEYTLPKAVNKAEVVIRSAITGKVVKQQTISVNEQSMLLNVPELKPGLYIYMLVADGQVVATDKMLILNDVAYE